MTLLYKITYFLILILVYLIPIIVFYRSELNWIQSFFKCSLLSLFGQIILFLFQLLNAPEHSQLIDSLALLEILIFESILILYLLPVSLLYRWSLRISNPVISTMIKVITVGFLLLPCYLVCYIFVNF